MKASPNYAIGAVPAVSASSTALWLFSIASALLLTAALVGFRRRDIGT